MVFIYKNKSNRFSVKTFKLLTFFMLFVFFLFQIAACGLTPIKKSATRKKIHTKEAPELVEIKTPKKVTERPNEVIAASPNTKLIFSSNRTGNLEIWIANLDGSKPLQLTDNINYESWWPRVSPDRKKVLFYRSPKGTDENSYDKASLWQIDTTGQNELELISSGAYGWLSQGMADWSPDGLQIILSASPKKNTWHLYMVDSDGKNPTLISKRKSWFVDPSWSPDGNTLVYCAFPEDYDGAELKHLEVFTSDLEGNNEKRLTFDELRDQRPYWSPDSQWIAFETQIQPLYWLYGKWSLRIAQAGSGKTIELINDGNVNNLPRWSPDSSQIYFHRLKFHEDKNFNLWRINIDGTNLVKIFGKSSNKDIQVDIY